MSNREAMQQALEALNLPSLKTQQMLQQRDAAIATLRAQLEQPEQSIDDLVAEFEATPKGAEAMRHGRDWVKDLQSEQPVGYVYWAKGHAEGAIDNQTLKPGTPLYASPPQRKPLTEEEILLAYQKQWHFHPAEEPNLAKGIVQFVRAIEQAHGIKETP